MRILIIGQNTKVAKLFSCFSDEIFMVIDSSVDHFRKYRESELYVTIETSTDVKRISSIFKRSIEIKKWVKDNNIDLIFTNEKVSMIAAKLATLFNNRIKLMSTSHNSYAWLDSFKVWVFSKLTRFSVNGYLALASFVESALIKAGFPKTRILMLPNIIEPNLFEKKDHYELNGSAVRIVYTSAIYRGKGQHNLLQASTALRYQGYDIRVDFIGEVIDPIYKSELDTFVENNEISNIVNFMGAIDNVELRRILKNYDIYVCPSMMEMSPYNILEAKVTGLPIIATDTGGIPDLICDGENGLLVQQGNLESMIAAIKRLIDNEPLRRKLGLAAFDGMTDDVILEYSGKLKDFIDTL